jgi:hypothetical protein
MLIFIEVVAMSLFGGSKSMKQGSSQGGTPKWLKNGEKILGEFGECSASIGLEQVKDVGTVNAGNDVSFGRVVVTNKRVLFFGKSGIFGQKTSDEEPGNIVTRIQNQGGDITNVSQKFAYIPNNKGFQLCFDVPEIRKRISESRPTNGEKAKHDFIPVTLVTDVKWVEKGVFGKQQIGMHIAAFRPSMMEAIKKQDDIKEELSNKKGLFASMQRGLINARESLVKFSPFGNLILFVKFKDQEMSNLNKFVQLLSDKTGAAADYKANEALVRKDYFH